MIKAIIFDVGGVLVYDIIPAVFDDIAHTLKIDNVAVKKAWNEIMPALSVNQITEEEYWKRFIKATKTTQLLPKESLLQRNYKAIRNEAVYKLVKQLKEKGYKLAVLSNTIDLHTTINRRLGIYDDFPVQILSNEVKLIKPGKEIFLLTSKKLQTKPEETIFIDDNLENVEVANALGFHGIHFTSAEALKTKLENEGVQL